MQTLRWIGTPKSAVFRKVFLMAWIETHVGFDRCWVKA